MEYKTAFGVIPLDKDRGWQELTMGHEFKPDHGNGQAPDPCDSLSVARDMPKAWIGRQGTRKS